MNAECLLAHFERISEAPDAVARLRRFILDLAVRGKLVEQDPEDEPAEDQLERIIFAKLEAGRKQRASTRKPENQVLEPLAYDLPSGWVTASLADLVSILNGRAYKQAELLDAGTPVLRVGNLFTSNKWYYSNLELDDDKYIDNGDLIFAWSASFGPFVWGKGRVIYHYHIWKLPLHSPPDLSRDYLYLYLLHKTAEIKDAGHGISMVHMTKEKMEGLEVPLPPLAEQHRIVARVDELMALCDQLEAARQERQHGRERLMAATLQRLNQPAADPASFRQDASFALQVLPHLTTTPAQIKQLRQTILNLAVRGKLVEQDPEDEPPEELLACFAEAKVKQKKRTGDARIKLEDDPSSDALPMTLPVGWKCQSFQNLFLFIDYRGNTPTKTVEGVPLITAKNVRMGRLDREPREFVSQSTYESWMTRGYPGLGDIFFTTEAPLGNVCLNNIEQPFALAQRVICFQPYAFICTRFIVFALMSDLMQTMIDAHATGMTAKGIKAAKLKPLPIPLPPLAEQHRIVAKVDELMALCDQLEQQLSQADQQRRRLLEAVLAEALGGRLPTAQEESHAAVA
ncbi:MAG: restriction endonuclease subunit S [Cyanobacteria bacterium]|nr:restriction endonuclease subunit S [Cyanobacteriota bacterium]